jgi:hypothetical protein
MNGPSKACIKNLPSRITTLNILYQIIIFCHYQTTRRRLHTILFNSHSFIRSFTTTNMVRISILATLACKSNLPLHCVVLTSPVALAAFAITPNNAGAKNVGQANGQQFITGGCTSDADCSSACCAGNPTAGVCSAVAASKQASKTGCGFVDPNAAATIAAAKAQVKKQGF